jgi:tRNA threonylcarbamoyladenosine biosynthesis protein TsaB
MNILAMDTCFGACSVAVSRDVAGAALQQSEFERRPTGHAEVLMPMAERVMLSAGISFEQLEAIAVTTGPGSFTGMRIGIAAARALGLALSIPVIGIPTLEAMAHGAEADGAVLIAVDARNTQVYVQLFGANRRPVTSPQVLSTRDAAHLTNAATVCGTGATFVVASNPSLVLGQSDLQPSAVSVAELAATGRYQSDAKPLYLRAPDAKPQAAKSLARAL